MKLISKEGHIIEVNEPHGQMLIETQRGNWGVYIEKVEEVVVPQEEQVQRPRGRPPKAK